MGAIPYTATDTMNTTICTNVTQYVKNGLKKKIMILIFISSFINSNYFLYFFSYG